MLSDKTSEIGMVGKKRDKPIAERIEESVTLHVTETTEIDI